YASRIFLTNGTIPTEDGEIPRHSIALSIGSRSGGAKMVRFNLEIAVRCDFADIFEVKSKRIVRRGKIVSQWSSDEGQLQTVYRNRDFLRDVTIAIRHSVSPVVYANGRLSFEVELQPAASWHACLL